MIEHGHVWIVSSAEYNVCILNILRSWLFGGVWLKPEVNCTLDSFLENSWDSLTKKFFFLLGFMTGKILSIFCSQVYQ